MQNIDFATKYCLGDNAHIMKGILRMMLKIDCEFGKIIQNENGKTPSGLILKLCL